MNSRNCHLIFLIILSTAFHGCAQNAENIRAYFKIDSFERRISIPVQIDDSITTDMTFDTGTFGLRLDSSFVAAHPGLKFSGSDKSFNNGIAWNYDRIPSTLYLFSNILKIGDTKVEHDSVVVLDYKKLHLPQNGVFGIPEKDRKNVWELNFEHNYLEIHAASFFKLPEDCYTFPMYNDLPNVIQFPIRITCADGDTLTINKPFFIDTGMPWDVAIIAPAKEYNFFNKKRDAVWLPYSEWYYKRYTVKATVFNGFTIDALRIYTFPEPPHYPYMVGLNFLKRFNVFFDLKNRLIGLQPINNFQRIVRPNVGRFHYSTYEANGKIIVKMVVDYGKNYFKTAGLKAGDEIVKINGIAYKNITREQRREFRKRESQVLEIIRNKKPMKIVVPIDKNEDRSD